MDNNDDDQQNDTHLANPNSNPNSNSNWDIYMPLIADAGHDAGFRIKNSPGETERILVTGYDRKSTGTAVLGRVYHVVHGFMRQGPQPQKSPPATLIVFEWVLRPGPSPRRFREVNIELVFAARGLRPGMLPSEGEELVGFDPAVVKVGPTVPLQQSLITYTVDKTSGLSLGASVGFAPYVSLEPQLSSSRTKAGIQRLDYSVQAGYPFLAKNKTRGLPNGVQWTFQENATQESGLPRVIRTAVLLERYNDDFGLFEATISTTCRVSFVQDAKESMKRAVGRIPVDDPIVFDPRPRADVVHGGVVLFGDKSDDVLKNDGVVNPVDFRNLKAADLDKLITITS